MSSLSTASLVDVEREPGKLPLLRAETTGDALSWAAEHRDALRAVVAEHGSVLVRGLGLRDAAGTGAVFSKLAAGLTTEKEAFAPRRTYSDGVYSSSKWPPNQPMCMHHELSYTLEFPGMMMFACLSAPTDGGATAVADSSTVLDALPAELTERFEREGWLLTRSYNDEIGATVAEAFGTDDRGAVESYCRANAITFEWQPDGGLRTRQRRGAVVRHPVTGRSAAGSTRSRSSTSGRWPPRSASTWWTSTAPTGCRSIPASAMATRSPRTSCSCSTASTRPTPHARRGRPADLMLVDNIRTAHSREPFEGPREVLVAMADPVHLADCSPTVEVTTG